MRGVVFALALLATCTPSAVLAWGAEGHYVVAIIARGLMTPAARAKADAILATDFDPLTKMDFVSRATWPDAYRGGGHRETASWHFADIELAHPDLDAACYHFPAQQGEASHGPANDCVADKIEEFAKELPDPKTSANERQLALIYLVHFVGDLHQPLHVTDNEDHGGNCVQVSLGAMRTTNLHSYWDGAVVEALGADPVKLAQTLYDQITLAERSQWEQGTPRDWAMEGFRVGKANVYTVGSKPGCDSLQGPITLPAGYAENASKVAAMQLQKAGVRLALILNRALS